jgi:glycine/D-amino acid oxidase-like deaminating enzyme
MAITPKVDLRTGKPIWLDRPKPRIRRSEARASSKFADVLVIGAGISGALVADVISEAKLSVIIVDRRGPVKGSSAASTALIQYEIDEPIVRLSRKLGLVRALRHYRRSKLGVDALVERSTRLGIEADVVPRQSLYLAGDVLDPVELAAEGRARERAGFDVSLLGRKALQSVYGVSRQAALLSSGNYAVNPVRLTAGFLNAAIARGAELIAPQEVIELTEKSHGVQATCRSGLRIGAKFAVYATGYELPFRVSERSHRLLSTWAIATKPQRRALWPTECLIWEASDPYLYLRTTPDGRVVCGGGDEDFKDERTRDALLGRKSAMLERKLHAMFPRLDPHAEFRWTGTFGATPTGTPSIGFLPFQKRSLAVLGYGGNGFTFSMIAAQVIRGLVVGEGDPDSDLYAFRARA